MASLGFQGMPKAFVEVANRNPVGIKFARVCWNGRFFVALEGSR